MPITALPTEIVGLILAQLLRVRNVKAVKRTCRAFRDAAGPAVKAVRCVCYEGHTGPVTSVTVATEGISRIITCAPHGSAAFDGAIKVWYAEDVTTINAQAPKAVAALNGARFVTGERYYAKLYHDDHHELTIVIGSIVHCVAAMPDGVHFVVGLGGTPGANEVRLYHVDGTLVHAFKGHLATVRAVAVTPDGQHIISGAEVSCDFDSCRVWSVANKRRLSSCVPDERAPAIWEDVWALTAMPDGQRFISGGARAKVRVWLLNGTQENAFKLHGGCTVTALVAIPDNQHALSGSVDKTVKLFNVNDGAVVRTFTHHTGPVYSLALMPDGRRFISGSYDRTARIVEIGRAM